MPSAPSFGHLAGTTAPPGAPAADDPFRIAVLADLSGRSKPLPPAEIARRKPVAVDPDDLDAAVAAVGPAVTLNGILGSPVELAFGSLDDFHPDALYPAAEKFADLDDREQRTDYMRAILRHPRFRPLEATWRGIDWLARRGRKGDRRVELVLFDLAFDELAAGVNAADDLSATPVYQALIEAAVHGPKGKPWAAVVGLYPFRFTPEHAQVLGRMAKIVAESAAPFLAGLASDADPATAPADAWAALRQLPEAAVLGLAAPGFLLRPPFGENTKSIEAFEFEEFAGPDDRAAYLWANPALAPAGVLAQGFVTGGWAFRPAGPLDLAGMPAHSYRDDDGDDHLTVAERWLDRKAAEKLTAVGVMSVLGVKGRDAVQLARLHAVAGPPNQPPAELYGRWGSGSAPPPRGGLGVAVGIGGSPPAAAKPADAPAAAAPAAVPRSGPDAAPPAAAPPAEDALDPELAALLGGLDSSPPAPDAAAPPPADEGIDPELADLLKDLDTPT